MSIRLEGLVSSLIKKVEDLTERVEALEVAKQSGHLATSESKASSQKNQPGQVSGQTAVFSGPRFQPKHKGFHKENWWVIDVTTGSEANGAALPNREAAEQLADELNSHAA